MLETLWIALPFVVALGSGGLSFILVQAQMQASASQAREELVEARNLLIQQRKTMEEKIRATEAEARRRALDEFLNDVRVEERHYIRETNSPLGRSKCLVVQERVCFRHVPLSQWIERELPLETEVAALEPPQPKPQPALAFPRRTLLR